MTLDKGVATGALSNERYNRDLGLMSGLKQQKTDDKDKVVAERASTLQQYMGMSELQGLITEAQKYKDEIEEMHVKHEHLNIKIKEMADGTEYL